MEQICTRCSFICPRSCRSPSVARQYLDRGALPREGQAHHHEAVAHQNHFVELDDLLDEVGHLLQVVLFQLVVDALVHGAVVDFGEVDAGTGRSLCRGRGAGEGQELRQVDVVDCSEHEDALAFGGELALQVAGGSQHGLDGAHTII